MSTVGAKNAISFNAANVFIRGGRACLPLRITDSWHQLAVSCCMQRVREQLRSLSQSDYVCHIKTYEYNHAYNSWYLVFAEFLNAVVCICTKAMFLSSHTMLQLSNYIPLIIHCACSQCRENHWLYVLCSF